MDKPMAGKGWRLLSDHEKIEDGDEVLGMSGGEWIKSCSVGRLVCSLPNYLTYRRRLGNRAHKIVIPIEEKIK